MSSASGGAPAKTCHADGATDCPCMTPEVKWVAPAAPKAGPVPRTLAAGETAWLCTCGQSTNYVRAFPAALGARSRSLIPTALTHTHTHIAPLKPFCDGSHKAFNAKFGTSLAPRPYKNETDAEVTAYLCACGKTKNPTGHCDGSHAK